MRSDETSPRPPDAQNHVPDTQDGQPDTQSRPPDTQGKPEAQPRRRRDLVRASQLVIATGLGVALVPLASGERALLPPFVAGALLASGLTAVRESALGRAVRSPAVIAAAAGACPLVPASFVERGGDARAAIAIAGAVLWGVALMLTRAYTGGAVAAPGVRSRLVKLGSLIFISGIVMSVGLVSDRKRPLSPEERGVVFGAALGFLGMVGIMAADTERHALENPRP